MLTATQLGQGVSSLVQGVSSLGEGVSMQPMKGYDM